MNIDRFDKFEELDIINEVHVDSKKKLRDSVHDIIVELEPKIEISYDDICKKLKSDYNIDINVDIFDKIIKDWYLKNVHTIFKSKDKKWLDPWTYRKTIERKSKSKVLGKGKRKADQDERSTKWKTSSRGHWRVNQKHVPPTDIDINRPFYYD